MEEFVKTIASIKVENVSQDLRPFFVIHKDGKVRRCFGTQTIPPSFDPTTRVESQDVVIEQGGVWVRLYKPTKLLNHEIPKMPLLIYFHGGGFTNESASSPMYHDYLNNLSSKGEVIIISVDYRKAPEYSLPIAYEDSWVAINWALNGPGHENPWIMDYVDLGRVFLGGDSAGANIAHHMAKRIGKGKIGKGNFVLKGVLLVHPFFWGKERIGLEGKKNGKEFEFPEPGLLERLWGLIWPGSSGLDDPFLNPGMDLELADLGGEKVVVWVAEKDGLRERGYYYKEVVDKSGCKASVEVVETLGEDHVFHLLNPGSAGSANSVVFMDQVVAFLNSA